MSHLSSVSCQIQQLHPDPAPPVTQSLQCLLQSLAWRRLGSSSVLIFSRTFEELGIPSATVLINATYGSARFIGPSSNPVFTLKNHFALPTNRVWQSQGYWWSWLDFGRLSDGLCSFLRWPAKLDWAGKAIVYILPIIAYRKSSSSQPLADPLVIVCHYRHLSSSSLFTCCCHCHVPWVSVIVVVIPSLLIWYHHQLSSIATYLLDHGNKAQPKTLQPSYPPVPLHKPTGPYLISGIAQPSL